MVDMIGSMVIKNELNNIKKNYYMFFVPFFNYMCIEKLEEKQIKEKIKIKKFNFDFIPINEDLFSL